MYTQTEGTELSTYSQTESAGKETIGAQVGRYSKDNDSHKAENNAGLANFLKASCQVSKN
jgi:hypothetical protein